MLVILVFIVAVYSTHTESKLSYQNHDDDSHENSGGGLAADCQNGKKQSPINIQQIFEYTDSEVFFGNYNKILNGKMMKKAHFKVDEADEVTIRLSRQNKTFILYGLHFHWECSEHLLDNSGYSMEAHLVHYNREYKNFQQAVRSSTQDIAVVGVLFELSEEDNPALQFLIDTIQHNSTHHCSNEAKISYRQLLPKKVTFLYQYDGSLTTPNCTENVLWNVIEEKSYISNRQLQFFQNLTDSKCRPVQPLNGRTVRKFKINITVSRAGTTFAIGQQLLLFSISLFVLMYRRM